MAIEVTGSGVRASSLTEAQVETETQVRAIFGEDVALTPQTPQGQLASLLALVKAEVGEAVVSLASAVSIDHASASQLDDLASLLLIDRLPGARSQVVATVSGVGGVTLPAGSRAATAERVEFRSVAAVVLQPGGVPVVMESVEEGAFLAPAGTLTRIATPYVGWEGVDNAADAVPGRERQSDDAFRRGYVARTSVRSQGPLSALDGALANADAGRYRVVENALSTAAVVQFWPMAPHAILAVVEAGDAVDIERAIESHRGMGVAPLTALRGGAPDMAALTAITAGTVTWDGTAYTGLDLSAATTPDDIVTALNTLLATARVTLFFLDGAYMAVHPHIPDWTPAFGTSTTTTALGLAPGVVESVSPGPFVRPRGRALTVAFTLVQLPDFPADGLEQVRDAVHAVVAGYALGGQVWANDILVAAESVPGSRVTGLTVQHAGSDVSGQPVPLDALWGLSSGELNITITTL